MTTLSVVFVEKFHQIRCHRLRTPRSLLRRYLSRTRTTTTRSSRFERVLVQIRMDSSSESREDSTEDPRRAKTANSDAVSSHRGLVWIQPTPPRVPTAISSVPKTTSFGGVVCCLVSFSAAAAAAVFFSLLLLVVFLTGSLSSPSFV